MFNAFIYFMKGYGNLFAGCFLFFFKRQPRLSNKFNQNDIESIEEDIKTVLRDINNVTKNKSR